MLRPFIDSMSAGPQGGHALFTDDDVNNADLTPTLVSQMSAASSSGPSVESSAGAASTVTPDLPPPQLVTYHNPQVTCVCTLFMVGQDSDEGDLTR